MKLLSPHRAEPKQAAQPAPAVPLSSIRRHYPQLDGLRGIAVLMVMFIHFGRAAPPLAIPDFFLDRIILSGWMGVDLFFVLSGFLITGILNDTKHERNYFTTFYARRFLRIFPLYYGVLLIYFTLLPMIGKDFDFLGDDVSPWWFWLYGSNIYQAFNGYAHGVLSITWSLSIEEHFYLFWPLIVWLLPRKALFRTLALVLGVSIIFRFILHSISPLNGLLIYMYTLTHLDGLVIGSAIALLAAEGVPFGLYRRQATWGFLLTGALLITCFGSDEGIQWSSWNPVQMAFGFLLIALFFGCILILAITAPEGSRFYRFLSYPRLAVIGTFSYSMYLIHPVLDWTAHILYLKPNDYVPIFNSSIPVNIFYILSMSFVTFVVAWLTWNLYEKHFLALKRFFPYGKPRRESGAQLIIPCANELMAQPDRKSSA